MIVITLVLSSFFGFLSIISQSEAINEDVESAIRLKEPKIISQNDIADLIIPNVVTESNFSDSPSIFLNVFEKMIQSNNQFEPKSLPRYRSRYHSSGGMNAETRKTMKIIYEFYVRISAVFLGIIFGITLNIQNARDVLRKPLAPAISIICKFLFSPLVSRIFFNISEVNGL